MKPETPDFAALELHELATAPRAQAETIGAPSVEVFILSKFVPHDTGLVRVVAVDGPRHPFVRNVGALEPLNDAARALLSVAKASFAGIGEAPIPTEFKQGGEWARVKLCADNSGPDGLVCDKPESADVHRYVQHDTSRHPFVLKREDTDAATLARQATQNKPYPQCLSCTPTDFWESRLAAVERPEEPCVKCGALTVWRQKLRQLPADPRPAAPVSGIPDAMTFAENLARTLCAVEPLPSMIGQITRAVRARDKQIKQIIGWIADLDTPFDAKTLAHDLGARAPTMTATEYELELTKALQNAHAAGLAGRAAKGDT